jgi:hypothetical protein
MNKYQVSVNFYVDDVFMSHIPEHRKVINQLIHSQVIDSYAISADSGRGWITMNAPNKQEAINHLKKSPLFSYFSIEVDELFVYDSQLYRLPPLVLN